MLLGLKMHTCGTLRNNRGEPQAIKDVKLTGLEVGETVSRHNGKVMVLAWRDKRIVKMVSTLHQDEERTVNVKQKGEKKRVAQKKPACVCDYNLYMNGVCLTNKIICTTTT